MRRSVDRILTTHVGTLQRPAELSQLMVKKGQDAPEVQEQLRLAVAQVVRQQRETGIDVLGDGEFGKSIWSWYVTERLEGIERREWGGDFVLKGRDRAEFAEFYQWADAHATTFGFMEDSYWREAFATQPVCTGPLRYRDGAVRRDIANLTEALSGQDGTEAFMPVVAPASITVGVINEYYPSDDEFLRALADAMKAEYHAIIDAGFLLQVDDAWLPALWDRSPELDLDSYRRRAASWIEVLNHALDGLPGDRIRYHICWGSWHGPHAHDSGLADIIDLVLRVNAGGYSIEAANSRHEHEYHLWEDVTLPEGKILIPGVVTHATNLIEHPELVAERIIRFADRVGRENVIASADCGFGCRIHPQLGWAKMAALVDGAALASHRLWNR
ncbi:MAG TPA: cobalamin-independent methionine synthase II family protein [Pseudonocardiaceae bacterium]|nr:cobalamin-independent methionine synthase II family protein [Pseudonocardiaceae bacterium]